MGRQWPAAWVSKLVAWMPRTLSDCREITASQRGSPKQQAVPISVSYCPTQYELHSAYSAPGSECRVGLNPYTGPISFPDAVTREQDCFC